MFTCLIADSVGPKHAPLELVVLETTTTLTQKHAIIPSLRNG